MGAEGGPEVEEDAGALVFQEALVPAELAAPAWGAAAVEKTAPPRLELTTGRFSL